MDRLALEIGRALRRARKKRGLTLKELARRSGGRFKPTSVAGYERGERKISVDRLCELVKFYDVSAGRLVANAVRMAEGTAPVVIELSSVADLESGEGDLLAEFTKQVVQLRKAGRSDTVSIRVGDLEVLATMSGHELAEFVERIRSALQSGSSAQTPRK
jgi:transcriptional regulator with XRE-family HTH domain